MTLLARFDRPKAYGATFDIAGVEFVVVVLVKQGFLDQPCWLYEVAVVNREKLA